jgi:hypothetical protein
VAGADGSAASAGDVRTRRCRACGSPAAIAWTSRTKELDAADEDELVEHVIAALAHDALGRNPRAQAIPPLPAPQECANASRPAAAAGLAQRLRVDAGQVLR